MNKKRRSLADRFFDRVMPEPNSGCWLWLGSTLRHGYGLISMGGREGPNIGAHRASLLIHGYEVPADAVVMHKCDNPACVNPAHLVIGTQKENIRDMWAKGRSNRPTGQCQLGHPYEGNAPFLHKDGYSRCRICNNERNRRRRARIAASIKAQ